MTTKNIAIIGGGASGVGLVWAMSQAYKRGWNNEDWSITLIHSGARLGGHSDTVSERIDGQVRDLDLGVQVIASAMYPTVMTMLAHPDFADIVLDPVELKIACAFPDDQGGSRYWGNFDAYQNTELYKLGEKDCATFEQLMKEVVQLKDLIEAALTLEEFLEIHAEKFDDLDFFKQYFLDPYMSIVNGYGQALLSEVLVLDVIPLFDFGLGAFTHETSGFARFRDGAGSWVQKMATLATEALGGRLTIELDTEVEQLYSGVNGPTVVTGGTTRSFDYIVSTVDMFTNSKLMSGHEGWEVFKPFIGDTTEYGTTVWDLQPGFCYLHQDEGVLAPGLPGPPAETLQFTAPATPKGQDYDLTRSYTTYIESNLLGIPTPPAGDQFYLTMYGFDPSTSQPTPVPSKGIKFHRNWVHGMWLPTFMVEQKLKFHQAQGISPHTPALHSQHGTGLFFAGNNLTMDSEEGALLSGFAVAKYLFGFDPMLALLPDDLSKHDWEMWFAAKGLYTLLYELMFAPSVLADPGAGPVVDKLFAGLLSLLGRRAEGT